MPSGRAEEFRRVAARLGFECRRQTGSHERWTHPDGRGITIPSHGGRDIGPPLFYRLLGLYRLLGQLEISVDDFRKLK
jgi:predicted RNA binding protein YcfA (HicA-like mRNA interferase family)